MTVESVRSKGFWMLAKRNFNSVPAILVLMIEVRFLDANSIVSTG